MSARQLVVRSKVGPTCNPHRVSCVEFQRTSLCRRAQTAFGEKSSTNKWSLHIGHGLSPQFLLAVEQFNTGSQSALRRCESA